MRSCDNYLYMSTFLGQGCQDIHLNIIYGYVYESVGIRVVFKSMDLLK